jgi:hypothetical protein
VCPELVDEVVTEGHAYSCNVVVGRSVANRVTAADAT